MVSPWLLGVRWLVPLCYTSLIPLGVARVSRLLLVSPWLFGVRWLVPLCYTSLFPLGAARVALAITTKRQVGTFQARRCLVSGGLGPLCYTSRIAVWEPAYASDSAAARWQRLCPDWAPPSSLNIRADSSTTGVHGVAPQRGSKRPAPRSTSAASTYVIPPAGRADATTTS